MLLLVWTHSTALIRLDLITCLLASGCVQSFVGSSQWIGAIELSYVLDDYLGVTCKIMTVNRWA